MMSNQRRLDWGVGMGTAGAAWLLYLATLAPTVLEADSGEFQFTAWLPGLAHPTGYPLYILLGWLWTHIFPVGEVAWRMNLLSTLLAAATVGLVYGAARQMVERTWPETPPPARTTAAAGAAATFAVTHTFWSQAIIAEVYALHALFVALSLWFVLHLTGRADFNLRSPTAKLFTLTCGLSLTHHSTMVLLLPVLGLYLFGSKRGNLSHPVADSADDEANKDLDDEAVSPAGPGEARAYNRAQQNRKKAGLSKTRPPSPHRPGRRRARVLITHACLFLAPLLLYLYIPLIAPATPYVTLTLSDDQILTLYDHSLRGFWRHVTGAVFRDELRPAAAGWDRFVLTGRLLLQQVGWLGSGLAAIGLAGLWSQRQTGLLLLTGAGSLAFLTFNLIYFIGDIFVLFIPVWLFVSLWIGLGGLGLAHGVARRFTASKARWRESLVFKGLGNPLAHRVYYFLATLVAFGLFFWLVFSTTIRNVEVSQAGNTAARTRWLEILAEPLPQNAVLLSNDRNEIMPLWYYQYVNRRRPDLLGLFPHITPAPAYSNIGRVLDQALASGRPVYLIKPMAGLSLKADIIPAGSLYKATAKNPAPPHPVHIALPEVAVPPGEAGPGRESVSLVGYALEPAPAEPGETVTITLYWEVTQALSVDYTSYVHLIDAAGQGLAQHDARPGGDFYPSSLWQAGEVLRDQHPLTLPADIPPGEYHFRVGLYYQPQPGVFEGMGPGQVIGSLTIFGES